MEVDIWVAVIACVAAVVGPIVTWLIARQDRNDARTNIAKDLELLRQMQPHSETYKRLELRVEQNVEDLVQQQDNRAAASTLLRLYLPVLVSLLVISVTIPIVGERGNPEWVRTTAASLLICFGIVAFRDGYLLIKLAIRQLTIWKLRFQLWQGKRTIAKQEETIAEQEETLLRLRTHLAERKEWYLQARQSWIDSGRDPKELEEKMLTAADEAGLSPEEVEQFLASLDEDNADNPETA